MPQASAQTGLEVQLGAAGDGPLWQVPEASPCCAGTKKPYVDDAGTIHWPMLFVYPETMQTDVVEDSSEEHTLADHLDAMFAEDAPPLQWDSEHAYVRSNIETYYLSHAAKPIGLEQLTEVEYIVQCFPYQQFLVLRTRGSKGWMLHATRLPLYSYVSYV